MGGRKAIHFDGYVMDVVQKRTDGWQADAYPFSLPAVRSWENLELHENVTFLVGENGSGKSTLIEAILRRDLMPKEEAATSISIPFVPIPTCMNICVWFGERGARGRLFSAGRELFQRGDQYQHAG